MTLEIKRFWQWLDGRKSLIGLGGSLLCRYLLPDPLGHDLALFFDMFAGSGLAHKAYKAKRK